MATATVESFITGPPVPPIPPVPPTPAENFKCDQIKDLMPPVYKRGPDEILFRILCVIGTSDNTIGGL